MTLPLTVGPDRHKPQRTRAIATREVLVLRSGNPARESAKVQLKALLRAHRNTPESEALYCSGDDEIQTAPPRRVWVAEGGERKQFYWVRSSGASGDSTHRPG